MAGHLTLSSPVQSEFVLCQEIVHEVFIKWAHIQPNATALIWNHKSITYAELNRASDCAAASLLKAGVRPGSFVPISLEKSPDLIISLLAVLKAGAAYSLLDPAWPESRLKEIITALDSPLVITCQKKLISNYAITFWPPEVDTFISAQDFYPIPVKGGSPCCVFFTSGTTGQPKGVVSHHIAITRLFRGNSFAKFSTDTVMPLAASMAWDAFSLELWGALLNGGSSWIVTEPYLSANELRYGIRYHKVNTVWLTASLFNMIVEEDCDAFLGLQQIMIGGERLSVSHVKKFLQQHPLVDLINGYGPVENTVFATTHQISLEDCTEKTGIPIGCPVNGTQVYVCRDNCLCDVGEIGEICIAGDGLALGYLNDPKLTDEKFVYMNITSSLERVYRSGDLGLWDGKLLHFKGRVDRQIKIRGHRIELAEIELKIEKLLTEVRSCRVIAYEENNIVK